ncbi:unnamed protein product [Rotaria socialis]
MRGVGFQNLVKILVEVGQLASRSKFEVTDILLHPTTISKNISRLYDKYKLQLHQMCYKTTTATTPKRKSLLTQCFDSKRTNRPQSSNSYQEIENYLNADYSDIPHNDDDLDDIDILSF